MRLWLLSLGSLALAGCLLGDAGNGRGRGGDVDGGVQDAGNTPFIPRCLSGTRGGAPDIDVLFVVDNSPSMGEEQAELALQFDRFVKALEAGPSGLPNLHVGVVSTDLGSGSFALQNCERAGGDRGVLQSQPRVAGCTPPQGRFIVDVDGPAGRMKNYSGTLGDTFSCIARLGTSGCGFEQPLQAMRRALDDSNPENAGFLRPGALLAVVFVGDEDDCSGTEPGRLYNPADNAVQSELGPLTSYRCFDFGIRCDGDQSRTTPGPRSGCRSNEASTLLHSVRSYDEFLRTLKGSLVVVSSITGNAEPVEVGVDAMQNPLLLPSCESARGGAVPGLRLRQLTTIMGGGNASICGDDWQSALQKIQDIAAAQTRCL